MARGALLAIVAASLLSTGVAAQRFSNARSPGSTIEQAPRPPQDAPAPPREREGHEHRDHGRAARPGDDLFRAEPGTYAPRYDGRSSLPHPFPVPYGYVIDPYPYVPRPITLGPAPERPAADDFGYLRLRIQPRSAQVYVDGFFIGTVEDLGVSRYPLPPGGYRIEIRAEGFETTAFDVRIRPYETVTYTKDLARAPAAEPSAPVASIAPAAARKALYVIPRCYAGDRPPVAADLPAGCTMAALRTLPTP